MKTIYIAISLLVSFGTASATKVQNNRPILAQNINTSTWKVIGDYVYKIPQQSRKMAEVQYKGVCRATKRDLYYWHETSTPYGIITTCEKRKQEKRLTVYK